jgi:hypothetical protein
LLIVTNKPILLSVVMLNVVLLNVVAPLNELNAGSNVAALFLSFSTLCSKLVRLSLENASTLA